MNLKPRNGGFLSIYIYCYDDSTRIMKIALVCDRSCESIGI